MTDFRGPLPLKDRDFAAVRAKVLAKIERRRAPVVGWALAAAAAIVLVIILIPRPRPVTPPIQARRPAPVIVAPPQPSPAPVQVAEKPQTPRKKTPQPQLVAEKGSPPGDEEITMNIQTADPNVRIIWISR